MPEGCTPKNVMGEFVAGLESLGIDVDPKYIERRLDASGKRQYHKASTEAANDVFNEAYNASDKKVAGFWEKQLDEKLKKPMETVKRVLIETRRAEGKFNKDGVNRTQPVIDFLADHIKTHRSDINAGKSQYFSGIKKVFDGIDAEGMPAALKGDFEKYKRFHMEGGRLYGASDSNVITQITSNIAGNTIQASPTVILGNPLEMAMKLPSLYPMETIPALLKTAYKGKWFGKVSELEALGVYDTLPEEGGGLLKKAAQYLTDNPLKTAFYYAGEMKGGQAAGLEAVEKGAFKYRPGNETTLEMSDTGRAAIGFLNYSMNTNRMQLAWMGALMGKSSTPAQRLGALRALTTYYTAAGMIGGLDAGIPEPVQALIRLSGNNELADQIDESRTPLTNLVKLGSIDSIFITGQMASRTMGSWYRDLGKSFEKLQSGDTANAAIDATVATTLALGKATNFLGMGDAQLQKGIKIFIDVARDDLEDETLEERLKKDYLPFLKAN